MSQDERIAAVEANSRQLRRQLEAVLAQYGLLERIRELEARLAKDSHNGGTAIMGVAQLELLRVTGPAVAVGVACLLLAGLTLLPALMALCGRALFWPALPRAGSLAGHDVPTRGAWVAVGRGVMRHPALIAATTVVVLAPFALSALAIAPSFDDLQSLPKSAPSVQAFQAYQQDFPETAQIDVFVSDPGHDLRQPQYAGARWPRHRAPARPACHPGGRARLDNGGRHRADGTGVRHRWERGPVHVRPGRGPVFPIGT